MSRDYRKLTVFQLADDLAIGIYNATRTFPNDEKFGLTSQMRRAAVSVAANIVEGSFRDSERDYVHFLEISLGSCAEVGYMLDLARRLGYLAPEAATKLQETQNHCARGLAALLRTRRAPA